MIMGQLSYLENVSDEPRETYFERKLASLRQALVEHPEDKLQLMQQILIYMHIKGKDDEIIQYAFDLLEIDNEKKYANDAYLILARSYVNKKETDQAIYYYRETIKVDPSHEEAIMELAELYEKQQDFNNALVVYDFLDNEEIYDGKENMFRYKGSLFYNKQDYTNALECYQKAYEIAPTDEDGWITESIGETYWQLKNFEESSKWFKQALEKNPQSWNAHYGMGLCYHHTDDSYRALHHYFEALKIKPDFTNAYNNIAAVTINNEGNIQEGIEMLKKAIENTPDEKFLGQIYLNLSKVYSKIFNYELANYYKAKFFASVGFDSLFMESDDDDDDDGDVLK